MPQDMPQDRRSQDRDKLALLIHLGAYIVGVGVCLALNLLLAPKTLWVVWVAAGWGIGLAAHALAYWLAHTRRRERVFLDPKARGFAVHLFAYVAVVILLLIVNVTVTPKVWWFYWVALGWGAGVVAHGACVVFHKRRAPHIPGRSRATREE